MTNRQFFFLFAGNFAVLFTGIGLFPLLPLYATTLGASPTLVGFYFASIFAANALGPMAAGWLSHYLTTRTTFVAAGIAGVVTLILLGQATTLTQPFLLTAIFWFAAGISLTLVTVLVGIRALAAPFGRLFYLLLSVCFLGAMTLSVGQLGMPLSRQMLAFSAASVASTSTVGGLAANPLSSAPAAA